MTPFRERNPVPIGAIGLAVILGLLVLAFNASHLPFLNSGTTYHADFADASGLKPGDDVRVAGVKVGSVTSVDLDGAQVRVGLRVSGVHVGPDSRAEIKIKTLLGQKYIALFPSGAGSLAGDIPLARTQTPLDVTAAFNGLGQVVRHHRFRVQGHAALRPRVIARARAAVDQHRVAPSGAAGAVVARERCHADVGSARRRGGQAHQ
jgi:ABC-type transporter Mla subunit MlaD